jgi:hypothetical protein
MRTPLTLTVLLSFSCLMLAVPSRAQNQQPAPAPATSVSSAPSNQSAPKKIWTNDDFSPHAAPAPVTAKATKPKPVQTKPAGGHPASWYRSQINTANNQIAGIDQKIATYQAALNGEAQPSQGVQEYHMRRADWQSEIQTLTKQKKDLLAKIDSLEEEAKHNGIDPEQLH